MLYKATLNHFLDENPHKNFGFCLSPQESKSSKIYISFLHITIMGRKTVEAFDLLITPDRDNLCEEDQDLLDMCENCTDF